MRISLGSGATLKTVKGCPPIWQVEKRLAARKKDIVDRSIYDVSFSLGRFLLGIGAGCFRLCGG